MSPRVIQLSVIVFCMVAAIGYICFDSVQFEKEQQHLAEQKAEQKRIEDKQLYTSPDYQKFIQRKPIVLEVMKEEIDPIISECYGTFKNKRGASQHVFDVSEFTRCVKKLGLLPSSRNTNCFDRVLEGHLLTVCIKSQSSSSGWITSSEIKYEW